MKRLSTCVACAAIIGIAHFVWPSPDASASNRHGALHVGQVVSIAGTHVKCAVARRAGTTVVECLPTKPRVGSYASLTSDRGVTVVQFRTAHAAKTVFVGRRHTGSVTCR